MESDSSKLDAQNDWYVNTALIFMLHFVPKIQAKIQEFIFIKFSHFSYSGFIF